MPTVFEWEKPLVELEEKINELRNFIFEQGIDFKDELNDLERKADKLRKRDLRTIDSLAAGADGPPPGPPNHIGLY